MLPPIRPIVDTGRYEAFPQVVRTASGRLIMAWASSDQHYATDSVGKMAWSDDSGASWSTPLSLPRPDPSVPHGSVPGLATLGGRAAAMAMCPWPYRGFIQLSSDDGLTWSAPKQIAWSSSSWTFPSWLAWLPSDTADGLMLATCYGGEGVVLVASADAGLTWTRRANPATGTAYNESSVTLLSDGRLLMLVRHETSKSIHALWSTDMGYTWTAPQMAVPNAKSLPACTQMPDGTLLLPIRDMSLDDSPESWAIASSTDAGRSWRRAHLSDAWMMYGDVVATSPTTGLLIGASQDRKSATNADIWQLGLELRDPADAPIRIRDTVGTICLTVPVGATVSGTVTIRYPPRTYVGTPMVRARLVQPVDGATVRIITVSPSDFTVRVILAAPATTTTYIPALWSAEGGVQSWATN